ncbi:hypothetical protein EX30DRAFT_344526 [Ascodesmis nigricans]|uniref:Uncharacterized protein n=1 Tax=Ascodesmis nigricans TaxID=341454 RepID=A0A4S2MNV0_9PEZI|nr:hypothetical protein EX30DRAFT_344526 [Ascodesmis nigricans]
MRTLLILTLLTALLLLTPFISARHPQTLAASYPITDRNNAPPTVRARRNGVIQTGLTDIPAW